MQTRRTLLLTGAASLLCLGAAPFKTVQAQAIERPARVIVGFPPGGSADVIARHLADWLRGRYASSVVVDNKPGAGGRLGVEAAKNGPADGSTILVTPNPMITIYPHLYKQLSYDPLRDLAPVTTLGRFPLLLVAGPAMPAEVKSAADLVGWVKANPGKASFGSSAPGSTQHFLGAMFAKAARIELEHVGYKGGGQAIQNLLGGQLPLLVGTPGNVMSHIKSGKLRAIASSGMQRSLQLPDVLTFKEAGYAELDVQDWFGVFVPAGTPREIVARLNQTTRDMLSTSETRQAFAKLMIDPGGESPQECEQLVTAEHRMWGPIVKNSGFTAD